jgi:hypothetical protein
MRVTPTWQTAYVVLRPVTFGGETFRKGEVIADRYFQTLGRVRIEDLLRRRVIMTREAAR